MSNEDERKKRSIRQIELTKRLDTYVNGCIEIDDFTEKDIAEYSEIKLAHNLELMEFIESRMIYRKKYEPEH